MAGFIPGRARQAVVKVEVKRKMTENDGETGRQTPGRNVISHHDLACISVFNLVRP